MKGLTCGPPGCCLRTPAYRDFYDSSLAYVNIGDIKELAAKIIELLNDADMREKLGKLAATSLKI